jgi:hypothetical protein
MLVLLSYVVQWWCFYFVCNSGTSMFAVWFGRCQVQLPVHKFYFRFVLNETSNKGRPVERSCVDRASCLWRDLFVSPRPSPVELTCYVTAYRTLHDAEVRAELSSRAIRRNSILQASRLAVPSLLRKPERCLCSWQRLRTFICDRLYRKRGKKQHRWWQTHLNTSREVCSDSVVGRLEFQSVRGLCKNVTTICRREFEFLTR